MILAAVLLCIIILLLIFILLQRVSQRSTPPPPIMQPPPDTPLDYATTIPDQITETALSGFLRARLAGTPLDGSTLGATPSAVVWVEGGDEVLVHLNSVQTRLAVTRERSRR
jgi:hypothetical protein